MTGVVRLTGDGGVFEAPATYVASLDGLVATVDRLDANGAVPRGRYVMTAHVGGRGAPGLALGVGHVREDGRIEMLGLARQSVLSRLGQWSAWTAMAAARAARRRANPLIRLVPQQARDRIRAAGARLRG